MTQRQADQIEKLKEAQHKAVAANVKLVIENNALRERLEKVLWMLVDQNWQTK